MAKCLLDGCDNQARRKFCCDKHKDRYHNLNNPRGKYAHLNDRGLSDDEHYYRTTHPFDAEALGQD